MLKWFWFIRNLPYPQSRLTWRPNHSKYVHVRRYKWMMYLSMGRWRSSLTVNWPLVKEYEQIERYLLQVYSLDLQYNQTTWLVKKKITPTASTHVHTHTNRYLHACTALGKDLWNNPRLILSSYFPIFLPFSLLLAT